MLRLSRLLFWWSALCAAAALLGPDRFATVLTAVAGAGLLASYGAGRLALRADAAVRSDALPPAVLDAATLQDIGRRIDACLAEAGSFEAGALGAARLLQLELGAREVAVHRVLGLEPPLVRLATLVDAAGLLGAERRVRLDHAPLGHAVRDARPIGTPPGPFALPLPDGRPVQAVLELAEIALAADPDELAALLQRVRRSLSALCLRLEAGGDGQRSLPA